MHNIWHSLSLITKQKANCFFADHVLNNTCWYPLDVQGKWKEESWQSPSISKTWVGPISLKGKYTKYFGDPVTQGYPWGHIRLKTG